MKISKKFGIAVVFIGAYLGLLGSLTWSMCAPQSLSSLITIHDWLYGLLISIFIVIGAALSFKKPLIGGTIALIGSIWYFVLYGYGLTSYTLNTYLVLSGGVFATLGSIIILLKSEHEKNVIAVGFITGLIIGALSFMILPVIDYQEIYETSLEITYVSNFYKISYFSLIFGVDGLGPNALGLVSFIFLIIAVIVNWVVLFLKNNKVRMLSQIGAFVLIVISLILLPLTYDNFIASGGKELIDTVVGSSSLVTGTLHFSYCINITIVMSCLITLSVVSSAILTVLEKIHPFVKPEKTLFDI